MKAKIFYIAKEQEHLLDRISVLLRDFVYADIEILPCPIDKDYNANSDPDNHKHVEQFVCLLRKSLITLNDFSIVLKKREDDSWCYLGYEYKNYLSSFSKYIELYKDNILSIFPAVTLINRMVMLPNGISELLSKEKFKDSKFDFLIKPFDLQGVKLVDFENSSELKSHFSDISIQIKKEIKQYYNRYIQQFTVPNPKLGKLYNLLDIKEKFLSDNIEEFSTQNIEFDIKVLSGPIKVSQPNTVRISLTNKTKDIHVNEVYLEIKGPSGAMKKSFKETIQFDGIKTKSSSTSFKVTPSTAPFCPVEISFRLADDYDDYNIFPIPLILDVVN